MFYHKKCENKNLFFSLRPGLWREGLKVIESINSETEDQENMVDEIIGQVQLRHFIWGRQIQKDVTEFLHLIHIPFSFITPSFLL